MSCSVDLKIELKDNILSVTTDANKEIFEVCVKPEAISQISYSDEYVELKLRIEKIIGWKKKERVRVKEVKHYICEICETEYADKQNAVNCEKSHCKPLEFEKMKYVAEKNNHKGYPVRLSVKMADGTTQEYKLV